MCLFIVGAPRWGVFSFALAVRRFCEPTAIERVTALRSGCAWVVRNVSRCDRCVVVVVVIRGRSAVVVVIRGRTVVVVVIRGRTVVVVSIFGRITIIVTIRGRTVKPSPFNSRGYAAGAPTETMYGVIYAP